MAYYPRKYYPEFPPLPRQSDFPPPMDARQLESDFGPVEDASADYVVNKRYKYYGFILCFLSVASFALEIANVVFTIMWFQRKSLAMPYLLTWIAAGVWGSIPVFITGVLAIKVAGTYKTQVRVFALFCSLSAVVFTPAMIALSIAEIILYPGNSIRYNDIDCYSFKDTGTLICPKFVLPLAVAILGGIEFYLTLMVTIIFCFCNRPGKETKHTKVTSPEDQSPDALFSFSPEIVRRRQAPYFRSLPPTGQPQVTTAADPETQILQFHSRGAVAPDLSLLRSYHDSRPCANRKFGIASAYNHGLSYGNLPGATAVSPFYGSIPSLAAFGAPGPNPAYRVVYS